MIDLILENLFSVVASMSVDRIIELKKQYNNQQILYMTTEQFIKTDGFRTEYRDVTVAINKDEIMSIASEDIEASKTAEEIFEKIKPIFRDMLITDNSKLQDCLISAIATQYRAKRNLSISLFDVLETQRKDTDAILNRVEKVDKNTLLLVDSITRKHALREKAIKSGVGRKMKQLVSCSAQNYIHIVTKNPPTFIGESFNELESYIETIHSQINSDFPNITADFLKKPISVIIPNPNGSLDPLRKDIDTLQFMWNARKQLERSIDDLLKYSHLLPDIFTIGMIELGNIVDSDLYAHALENGMAEMLKNSIPSNETDYVNGLKYYYRHLGEQIITMYGITK